ncbi:MAG: nucleotidyltransferase family protein [Desulfosarcinaceae bacterium]
MHPDDSRENAFATREQELLLQAALLKGDPALEAWRRWWDLIDFEKEMDAGSFRLLPLLFHNLKKHDVVHPVMDRLKGLYRHAWYNNHRLFFELSGILKCIHAAGIPTMVLKGAALTVQVYKNHAIRPMADIDILVPQDRAILAHALLTLKKT